MSSVLMILLLGAVNPFLDVFRDTVKPSPTRIENPVPMPTDEQPAEPIRLSLTEQAGLGRFMLTAYSDKDCRYCKDAHKLWDGDPRYVIDWTEDAIPPHIKRRLSAGYKFPVLVMGQPDGSSSWPKFWKLYSPDEIVDMCEKNGCQREPVAAAGVGAGVLENAGPMINGLLGWWRTNIGEGVKASGEWDAARDKPSVSLLKGSEWTPPAIYGESGEYRLTVAGGALPVKEASLRYRFVEGRLKLYGETELDAGFLDLTRKPEQVAAGQPVGFGPGAILTVFSVLQVIWQVMHPEADVILPGRIAADAVLIGDNLTITFRRAPSVRVVMWWTMNLSVQTVDISPQRVRFGLSGSRWFRSKTLQVGGAAPMSMDEPEPVFAAETPPDEHTKPPAVQSGRLTVEQLRAFAARYRGPSVGVVGNDFRRHLTDPNHGFSWWQVQSLTQAECERVHSGHHNRALTTTAIMIP